MKLVKTILLSSITLGTVSGVTLTTLTPTIASAKPKSEGARMFFKFLLKATAQFLDWLADKMETMSAGESQQHNVTLNLENIKNEGAEYGMTLNSSETQLTVSKDVLIIESNKNGAAVYLKAGRYQINNEGGCTPTFFAK